MANVLSGARAKLIVNGNEIGYASNVSASEQIALQRVDVLGDIDSKEIVPVGRAVSVQEMCAPGVHKTCVCHSD